MANSKLELLKQKKNTRENVYSKSQKAIQNKIQLNLSLNCKKNNQKNPRLHVHSKSQEAEQNKSQLNLSLNRKKQRLASKETGKYLVQTNKQKQLCLEFERQKTKTMSR